MGNINFNCFRNHLQKQKSIIYSTPLVFWQTDMHSHLLPSVDDGVQTLDQSITCIRALKDYGINKFVITPHISHRYNSNNEENILINRDKLQLKVISENIPVKIEVAAEYLLDAYFINRLNQKTLLSFGPERYLLIETELLSTPLLFDQTLFNIQTKGYTPVLAHPERYHYYFNSHKALKRIRDQGCLFQLNWMSLTGRYGTRVRDQAKMLLQQKWVDFIGSDMHGPGDIKSLQKLFKVTDYSLLNKQTLLNDTL